MRHDPRPAIHMGKQLGWTSTLGGTECLGISKTGQTVLASLMESQILYPPASSVWGEFRKRTMASAHPGAFSFFLCPTGAFQAATPGLELRKSESE